jgi:AcrR family transcriptional regulator
MARHTARNPPRNQPQQARSRVTVAVILDAAIRILDREGLDALNTSHVAEVAGVSVGTLYQYFAHREAIMDALQRRELAAAMLERQLARTEPISDRELVRSIVGGLLELYQAAPALHRVLAVEGLRLSPPTQVLAFDQRSVARLKAALNLAGSRLRATNLEAAAFVLYQSVRATMLAYFLDTPPGLSEATLVDELTELCVRYLGAQG